MNFLLNLNTKNLIAHFKQLIENHLLPTGSLKRTTNTILFVLINMHVSNSANSFCSFIQPRIVAEQLDKCQRVLAI